MPRGWTDESFWGSLWSVLCEEGAWIVINRNHVDCETMCGLLGRFYQVELWIVWMCHMWAPPLRVIKLYHVWEAEISKKKVFRGWK